MKRATLATLLLLALSSNSTPQGSVVIHNGFLKAQTYFDMTSEQQRFYVMGALDGMYEAPMFGAPENDKLLRRIEQCVDGMKGSQVSAIVLKYTKDHPEFWHWDLKDVTYNAMLSVCPIEPTSGK